jgi:hypothetical protein
LRDLKNWLKTALFGGLLVQNGTKSLTFRSNSGLFSLGEAKEGVPWYKVNDFECFGSKWHKMVQFGSKWWTFGSIWFKMVENGGLLVQNGGKWFKMAKNDQKRPKMAKNGQTFNHWRGGVKTFKNIQKRTPKTFKIGGQKGSKIGKKVQNRSLAGF